MIVENKRCYLCGRVDGLEVHHCLHGSYRKMADKYGLTVYLCHWCHARLHDHGEYDKDLQEMAQIYFEANHKEIDFMRVFGKNFRR